MQAACACARARACTRACGMCMCKCMLGTCGMCMCRGPKRRLASCRGRGPASPRLARRPAALRREGERAGEPSAAHQQLERLGPSERREGQVASRTRWLGHHQRHLIARPLVATLGVGAVLSNEEQQRDKAGQHQLVRGRDLRCGDPTHSVSSEEAQTAAAEQQRTSSSARPGFGLRGPASMQLCPPIAPSPIAPSRSIMAAIARPIEQT